MATKRKRKNTGGKPLIITFVCLVAVTLAVFGVFFGADKYERSTHPMLYSDLVDRYSSQYKLDKYVVYSFICVESGFNENSESYLGARGLMQIMPETFEWIRYKLDEENDPDMTFDNMYNVRITSVTAAFCSAISPIHSGNWARWPPHITQVRAVFHRGLRTADIPKTSY